jgi:hypothetical protein
MKSVSAVTGIILISMAAGSAAYPAIPCQDAPGREQRGVYWSWREIEGKRCWFIRQGRAMPPKSAFAWAKEEAVKSDVSDAPETTEIGAAIQILRVKPDNDLSDSQANWLDDAPVELIIGEALSGAFGVGGSWVFPVYNSNEVGKTSPLSQHGVRERN